MDSLSSLANMKVADFPLAYDRRFSLHFYWVSHGLLLLRSVNESCDVKRVDLLFRDVWWINMPAFIHGLLIEKCEIVDQPPAMDPQNAAEFQSRCQYKITSGSAKHYLVASPTLMLHEDSGLYHENSALLPGFDFNLISRPSLDEPDMQDRIQ